MPVVAFSFTGASFADTSAAWAANEEQHAVRSAVVTNVDVQESQRFRMKPPAAGTFRVAPLFEEERRDDGRDSRHRENNAQVPVDAAAGQQGHRGDDQADL